MVIFVGYPTETDQDFKDTMDMFTRYQKYAIEGTLYGVNLGALASLDDGTPLYKKQKELDIVPIIPTEHAHGLNWQSKKNPVTIEERILRRIFSFESRKYQEVWFIYFEEVGPVSLLDPRQ